jgi:hypothetical protein
MAIRFGNSIDLNGNQIQNFRVHVSASAPSSPAGGMMWWDSGNRSLKYYNDNLSLWLPSVTGPASSSNGYIPTWNGTSGNRLSEGLSLQTAVRSSGVATDTALPTEKAVRDAIGTLAKSFKGDYNALTNTPDLDTTPSGVEAGDMYHVSASGTFFSVAVDAGDLLVAITDGASLESDWIVIDQGVSTLVTVDKGGTGLNAASVIDGQLLIGHNANNNFSLASPLGSNGVTVTPGAGSLSFSLNINGLTETMSMSNTDMFPIYNGSNRKVSLLTLLSYVSGGSTPTAHGSLTGLSNDDHTQYFNTTRGDLRYAQASHSHIGYIPAIPIPTGGNFPVMNGMGYLATSSYNYTSFEPAITKSTGFLKWTGSAWSFDTHTFIPAISGAFSGYFPQLTASGTLIASAYQPSDFEPSITKSNNGYLRWTGTGWELRNEWYQALDADLTAIAGLTGTTGFLKKTASNTWTLDTYTYERSLGNPTVSGYLLASTTAGVRSWVSRNDMYTSFQTLTPSAAVTWNLVNGYNAKITLDRNVALSLSNVSNGMSGCLIITQNSTGGWTFTLPSSHKIIDGGLWTISSAANSITILTFVYDGTYFYWSVGNNYLGTT